MFLPCISPLWCSLGLGWSRAFLPSAPPFFLSFPFLPSLFFSSSFSCLSCLSCPLSALFVVWAALAPLFVVPFCGFFLGCDPVIVAFLCDGFTCDARAMSYFVSGCAPGGCETDSVFYAGVPRLPDFKDFVLEAVASSSAPKDPVLKRARGFLANSVEALWSGVRVALQATYWKAPSPAPPPSFRFQPGFTCTMCSPAHVADLAR